MSDIADFVASLVEEVRSKRGERVASGGREGRALGTCPKCGSPVVETKKSYGCSAWKTGCKFAIWKTVSGKRLSASQARELLTQGRTGELKGFKSRAGRPYSAALRLDEEHRVRLVFDGRD